MSLKPSPLPLGFLIALVGRATRQLVAAQVEPLGLSVHQFWTLVHLAEHPAASQTELAAREHVDEATTCRVVRSLVDAGLLQSVRDAADRRRMRLDLTAAGADLVQRLLPVARSVRGAVETALQPAEREACRAALTKVLARLDDLRAEMPAAPGAPAEVRPPAPSRTAARPRAHDRRRSPALRGSP